VHLSKRGRITEREIRYKLKDKERKERDGNTKGGRER